LTPHKTLRTPLRCKSTWQSQKHCKRNATALAIRQACKYRAKAQSKTRVAQRMQAASYATGNIAAPRHAACCVKLAG
jgi:hypothetical protein